MAHAAVLDPGAAPLIPASFPFQRALERVTLLTALLGFSALAVTAEVEILTVVFGYAFMILSIWRERLPWVPTDKTWNKLNLLVLGVCLAWWHLVTHDLLPPIILFTTWLLVVRLMSPKKSRDTLQIYVISFGMLLLSSVLTTTILFLPIFLMFGVSALMGLLLLTIRREVDRSRRGESHASLLVEGTDTALGALVNRRFVWGVCLVALALYLVASGFFIGLPRYQGNDWFRNLRRTPQQAQGPTLSGMGDSVGLGEITEIRLDPTIVMRVSLPEHDPTQPMRDHLRLRGQVLGLFDGQRWTHSEGERHHNVNAINGSYFEVGQPGGRERLRQNVTLEVGAAPFLFGQNRPTLITYLGQRQREIDVNEHAGTARMVGPPRLREAVTYSVVSDPIETTAHPGLLEVDGSQWEPLIIEPGMNLEQLRSKMFSQFYLRSPRMTLLQDMYTDTDGWADYVATLGEVAQQRVTESQAGDPIAIANEFVRRFHRDFRYTLSPVVTTPDFPVDGFVRDTREGHCEYFATSMVLMLRTLGIPARLVTGYYTQEWNASGPFFVVRESHAHVWVEVLAPFPDARGWLPFDPTPPGGLPPEIRNTIWRRINHWLDAHRFSWYRWVIDLSQTQQRELLTSIGLPMHGIRRSIAMGIHRLLETTFNLQVKGPAVPGLLLLLLLAGAAVFGAMVLLKRGGVQFAARNGGRRRRVTIDYYRKLVRWLKRRGHVRAPGMTPPEFASALARKHPELVPVREITEIYYRDRFARLPLTPEEEREVQRKVESLIG